MVEIGPVKAVRLLMHFGILPEIWFKARSKSWRCVRWHRYEGMLPEKWFDRRKSTTKSRWLLPNHISICPDKLLSQRLTNFYFVQFFNEEGSSPVKLLLPKSSISIPSKEPIEFGIFPWKRLFAKLRILSPSKCIQ